MSAATERDEVDRALARPRSLLAADGFDLVVRPAGPGVALEVVAASPDACVDCLVPPDLFLAIVSDALAEQGLAVDRGALTVTYPEAADDAG